MSRNLITFALLGAALASSVLMIGGVPRIVQAVVALLVAAALLVQLRARRKLSGVSPLLIFIGVASALTALQLVPLPAAILEILNPTGNELRGTGAELAGTSPWSSISLDPAGTLRALVFFIILGGVAIVSLRICASEKGRFGLLAAVAATCGLAALTSGVHVLLNLDALYGVYTPLQANTHRVFGPLLNSNHLGSLMSLGAVVSIGLAFYPRQTARLRVVWIVNAVACLLLLLLTLSRGAVLAFAFGAAVTGVALIARPHDGPPSRRRSRDTNLFVHQLPIAIVVAFGLALTIYLGAGKVASQLDNASLTELDHPSSKYAAWKSSLQLVDEAPWLGIGRGALEPALTRVHDPAAYVTFAHLENEYLQAVVEWGFIGAVLLLFAFAYCMARAAKRWRDGPLAAAALGGLSGIALQSTVDFGVQLLGIAVPVTIVAATLLPVALREQAGSALRVRTLRLIAIAALVGAAGLILHSSSRSIQEDHRDMLEERWTVQQIQESIERHPVDYFGFAHTASTLMRAGDSRAASFLNQSLRLHPTHPGVHRLVAMMLLSIGNRSQAAVEYSIALRRSAAPTKLIAEILTRLPKTSEAAAAMPLNLDGVETILRILIEQKRPDVAMQWLLRVIALPQRGTIIIDRLYNLALQENALEIAETAARKRLRIARTTTSRLMLAKVHAARKNQDQLLNELADVAMWRGRLDEKTEAWLLVCGVHIERKAWDPALHCLHQLDGSGSLLHEKRHEVTKRLNAIKEQRSIEARQHALEAVQRELEKTKKR